MCLAWQTVRLLLVSLIMSVRLGAASSAISSASQYGISQAGDPGQDIINAVGNPCGQGLARFFEGGQGAFICRHVRALLLANTTLCHRFF